LILSSLLQQFDWIDHGFGTRSAPLSHAQMASLKQIHSSVSLVADRSAGCVGEGDALITNKPGVAVSVRTADCYPILLVDRHIRAVAAVHAGWRGTAAGIVGETLERMRREYGIVAGDVYAAIGPGIGACCYEVGPEVAREFGVTGRAHIDLAEANRRQLIAAGVLEAHIDVLGFCTSCNAEQFHSYRRDKDGAGRMISYIRLS
jgi:YfiH family protein